MSDKQAKSVEDLAEDIEHFEDAQDIRPQRHRTPLTALEMQAMVSMYRQRKHKHVCPRCTITTEKDSKEFGIIGVNALREHLLYQCPTPAQPKDFQDYLQKLGLQRVFKCRYCPYISLSKSNTHACKQPKRKKKKEKKSKTTTTTTTLQGSVMVTATTATTTTTAVDLRLR